MVDGVTPIDSIRVGARVRTLREGEGLDQARVPASEIDPSTWRLAKLVVAEGTEHQVDVELLRSSDWLGLHGIAAGEAVELYLPEMGVKGPRLMLQ